MTTPEPNLINLTIDSVAYGGKGVSRFDGKVYFVEDTVPGDHVLARVETEKERYGDAKAQAFVTKSSLRGTSPCSVSEDCGGCQWIGINYPMQLNWKKSFVESALKRIGKLGEDYQVDILGSPNTLNYRNRILVRVHHHETGLKIGYFKRGSRELIPITACQIAAPLINQGLENIRALNLDTLEPFKVRIELQEVLDQEKAKKLVVTVYPAEGNQDHIRIFTDLIRELPMVHWAGLVFDLKDAPDVLWDEDLGLDFCTIPGQFQQVNMPLNRELRRLVKEFVDLHKPKRILDVFCGSGNLSLPLADGKRYVEGVEFNKKAIVMAKRGATRNSLTNTNYLSGDGEAHLWKCDRAKESFDLVILDPPRQGMYKGMVPLKNIAPNHIIYVSCDPTTLARDLGYLCRKDFYKIERVVSLDFFPNTYHVETVVFLKKTR